MEERADAAATAHQVGVGRYARALESIYRRNRIPAVLWRGAVHPDLYERLLAVGVEPGFDRPRPPSRGRLYVALLSSVALTLGAQAGAVACYAATHAALRPPPAP